MRLGGKPVYWYYSLVGSHFYYQDERGKQGQSALWIPLRRKINSSPSRATGDEQTRKSDDSDLTVDPRCTPST